MTGQAIALNGNDSSSLDGSIIYYYWDFGDGTAGTGANPNHQYNADGIYSVWLTVCDDSWNCASSQSHRNGRSFRLRANTDCPMSANGPSCLAVPIVRAAYQSAGTTPGAIVG